ncbi:peptidoglycan bridge formation glycyltransferase FemA/FemB family protein [Patescibacteria group bacterium]|nr:peptidoglycan bridge formation glycyltransferase FemA/FemB family protein [Patescibacteria group bacterium]
MDVRQSNLWAKYLEELGWRSSELRRGYFAYFRKIPLLGTLIKIPRAPLPIPLKEIEALAQNQNSFFLKIEPTVETNENSAKSILSLLNNYGFTQDRWALSPTRTIKINLTKSEEGLLKDLEKDTRYSVRLAIRRGVRVRQTDDFEEFKKMYYDTAKRKKFWPAKKEIETLWKIFHKGKSAAILTAYYNNEAVASTLLLYHGTSGHYQHAASIEGHRDIMAPYLLLWEAMKFLKKKGCRVLDLEGIYDPRIRSTRNWKGFTLFKRGFGGEEIEYLGSFVKYPKLWSKILFLPSRFF